MNERSGLCHNGWYRSFDDGCNFLRVCVKFMFVYYQTKETHRGNVPMALFRLQNQAIVGQNFENDSGAGFRIVFIVSKDVDVVKEGSGELSQGKEGSIHDLLECGRSIGELEWHNGKFP